MNNVVVYDNCGNFFKVFRTMIEAVEYVEELKMRKTPTNLCVVNCKMLTSDEIRRMNESVTN